MAMRRILKKGLVPLSNIEDIERFQMGDFGERFSHGSINVKLLNC
jgi:hypothetical protein